VLTGAEGAPLVSPPVAVAGASRRRVSPSLTQVKERMRLESVSLAYGDRWWCAT